MAATYYSGVHGTLTVETGATAIAEFDIKIDRGVAAHARSGSYSDIQAPGKLSVSGTIKRIMITDAFLDYMYGAEGAPSIIDLVGAVTSGDDSITITANNCLLTGDGMKFSDANEIVSEDISFVMSDPVADLSIVLGEPA